MLVTTVTPDVNRVWPVISPVTSERMATNDLPDSPMVPVLLLDGSLQYPPISTDTTAQDLIETLIQLDEVKCTVIDVTPSDWALQRVRKEKPGRLWDEIELAALSDGEHSVDTRLHAHIYVPGVLP